MSKKKPTGFVAICQCGKIVGAMDFTRTPIKDAGKILGQWIGEGCIVEPRFTSSWSANIESCSCRAAERGEG
jgi:hypothetical protein